MKQYNQAFPLDDFFGRPRKFFGNSLMTTQKIVTDLKFHMERIQKHILKSIEEKIGDGKGKKIENFCYHKKITKRLLVLIIYCPFIAYQFYNLLLNSPDWYLQG